MNPQQNDWLAQLAADHAPAPVGWWPPAPGWWLLGALAVVLALALAWWWRRPARRLRRVALLELKRLELTVDDAVLATELEDLMRRYAVAAYGRSAVARLCGRGWLEFLGARGGDALDGEAGNALLSCVYGAQAAPAREAWLRGARGFLRYRA